MANVDSTGVLPINDELKLSTKSSEAINEQSLRRTEVCCCTKRPVEATVRSLISSELVTAKATGQCDAGRDSHKTFNRGGVV